MQTLLKFLTTRTHRFAIAALLGAGALATPSVEAAPAGNFGAGIILGDPTGLSAKYWMNSQQALDFGLAYNFRHDWMLMFVDFKHHFTGKRLVPGEEINPYVGIGLVAGFRDADDDLNNDSDMGVGVRIPLGLEWIVARGKLGVFLELVPGLVIAPETDMLIMGGIGIRYYF